MGKAAELLAAFSEVVKVSRVTLEPRSPRERTSANTERHVAEFRMIQG